MRGPGSSRGAAIAAICAWLVAAVWAPALAEDCNGNRIPDDVETEVAFVRQAIFDGDGDTDVLAFGGGLYGFENTGAGSFGPAQPIVVPATSLSSQRLRAAVPPMRLSQVKAKSGNRGLVPVPPKTPLAEVSGVGCNQVAQVGLQPMKLGGVGQTCIGALAVSALPVGTDDRIWRIAR